MTNHMHLVFRSAGDNKPEDLLGDFKRFTSRAIVRAIMDNPKESRRNWLLEQFKKAAAQSSYVKHHQFWRHDNKPIEIWSNKILVEKIRYIHNIPVEEGLVFKPENYVYSSARDYSEEQGLLDNIIVVDLF